MKREQSTQKQRPYSCYEIALGYCLHRDVPPSVVVAQTPGQAKYSMFLDLDGCYETFADFLRDVVSCKRVYALHQASSAGFAEMAKRRNIPHAKIGMCVDVNGKRGVIAGYNASDNLDVLFDGVAAPVNCHPHDHVTYYSEDGAVLGSYS